MARMVAGALRAADYASRVGSSTRFGPLLRLPHPLLLGISPRHLAGVERAERNMSLATVESLAAHFELTPRIILDGGLDSHG